MIFDLDLFDVKNKINHTSLNLYLLILSVSAPVSMTIDGCFDSQLLLHSFFYCCLLFHRKVKTNVAYWNITSLKD